VDAEAAQGRGATARGLCAARADAQQEGYGDESLHAGSDAVTAHRVPFRAIR